MRNDDVEFYRDRRRAANAMSEAAAEPAIRGIHLAMAQRYADLAGDPELRAEQVRPAPDDRSNEP